MYLFISLYNAIISWRILKCPASCEAGKNPLALQCIKETNNDGGLVKDIVVKDIYCADLTKPGCTGPCIAYGEWSDCCAGQSQQQRLSYCKSNPVNGYKLSDAFCQGLDRGQTMRACLSANCPVQWQLNQAAPCSVTCGEGHRMRLFQCVQNNGIVSNGLCAHLVKPETLTLRCSMPACPRPAPTPRTTASTSTAPIMTTTKSTPTTTTTRPIPHR